MAKLIERFGSRDFSGERAQYLWLVIEAGDEQEAMVLADGQTPVIYRNMVRDAPSVAKQGPGAWYVDFEFRNARQLAEAGAGNPPPPPTSGGGTPVGTPPETPVGPEMSFSMGGEMVRITTSRETLQKKGRAGAVAPNFHNLIGVSKDGVEGCEVYAKGAEFTVTQKFTTLTVGYMLRLFASIATTNDEPFRGADTGEVLLIGADGGHKEGDPVPWTIAGHFKYMPNWTLDQRKLDGDLLRLDDPVPGWSYVWMIYGDTTEEIGGVEYTIKRPKFAYVERVYDESKFADLKMG